MRIPSVRSLVGFEWAVLYGTLGAENTVAVVAVDEAGNRSAPATLVVDLRGRAVSSTGTG